LAVPEGGYLRFRRTKRNVGSGNVEKGARTG
jgi:hypothetical protein